MNSNRVLELRKRVIRKGIWHEFLGENKHAFQGKGAQKLINSIQKLHERTYNS
jgi:hypothetical protein